MSSPKILLLDEATSALDAHSETEIQKTIDNIAKSGVIVIIVAHRLSTIMNSDKIIVLENGKNIEEGSHYDLLEKNGFYTNLIRTQALGLDGFDSNDEIEEDEEEDEENENSESVSNNSSYKSSTNTITEEELKEKQTTIINNNEKSIKQSANTEQQYYSESSHSDKVSETSYENKIKNAPTVSY